jgi:hypothetical protein
VAFVSLFTVLYLKSTGILTYNVIPVWNIIFVLLDMHLDYFLHQSVVEKGLRDFYQNTRRRGSDPCRRFFNVIIFDVIVIVIIGVVVAWAANSCN